MAIEFTVEFAFRVVIYPAPDMRGKWIAHGLETDIVTQGDSKEDALEMMTDAINTLAAYNAKTYPPGLAIPLRPAPREVWDLVGDAVPSHVWARATIRKTGVGRLPVPGGWPVFPFVSAQPPRQADAP